MLLKITEKCSMGCTHCMNNSTPDGAHMTEQNLSMALYFLVKHDIYDHIIVTGGEPTEHPDFMRMIHIIFDVLAAGKRQSVVTITTNGFWCLEHQKEATEIARGTEYTKVLWQVSTDSRYYPKELPKHKRIWREPGFVLCDKCVTRVYPQGRALENNLPWKAKASKCFNVRAITKQLVEPSLRSIVRRLAVSGFHCTPAIRVDGSIGLGESDLCPPVATVYDSEEDIIKKIKGFQCHQCDFVNEQLDPIYKQFL